MSAIGSRIAIWPGRELRRAAREAGCDPDVIAQGILWQAGTPIPGDDIGRWNRAFREALETARADRGADDDFTSN